MLTYLPGVFSLLLLLSLPVHAQTAGMADSKETITYISLNEAVHQGQLDGVADVKELKRMGDFGLGSTEALQYEVVLLDGIAYGIPADGKAVVLKDAERVAYGAATWFRADRQITVKKLMTLRELESVLDSILDKNRFTAIKVRGHFSDIRYRCFDIQKKPYKPTDQIPNVIHQRSSIKATLVGFYTPSSVQVLNSPVYHFHFVDDNRSTGGHVLECTLTEVVIETDEASSLSVKLPLPEVTEYIDLNKSSGR